MDTIKSFWHKGYTSLDIYGSNPNTIKSVWHKRNMMSLDIFGQHKEHNQEHLNLSSLFGYL